MVHQFVKTILAEEDKQRVPTPPQEKPPETALNDAYGDNVEALRARVRELEQSCVVYQRAVEYWAKVAIKANWKGDN